MREGYISHRFLTIAFLRDDLVCTGVGAHACGLIPYLKASNALDEFFLDGCGKLQVWGAHGSSRLRGHRRMLESGTVFFGAYF